ncbi:MAG: hypothetical protein AAB511_01825 [Patescibacteria group bacterium]
MESDRYSLRSNEDEDKLEAERLLAQLERLVRNLESSKNPDHEYVFFRFDDARIELARYCERVVDFLHANKIPNMVIVDRSSRPMYIGVMEYWRDKYPDEKMPGIYFMNPKGFKARDTLTPDELVEVARDCELKDDLLESPRQARTEDEIVEELKSTYTHLMVDKDKPLLVFDSCIHSGDTLSSLKDTLEKAGFTNIIIGSVNPSDVLSSVPTDFYITEERPAGGCYPFDRDRMIEKTFNHVYSKKSRKPEEVALSKQLREEIKRIIKESIEKRRTAWDDLDS